MDDPSSGDQSDIPPETEKMDDLSSRIEKAEVAQRQKREPFALPEGAQATLGAARIGADFVGAVAGGGVLGWGVDHIWDTQPWGLLLFLFGGFVSGLVGVVRAFDHLGRTSSRKDQADPSDGGSP